MSDEDHRALVDLMLNSTGMFVLSGYQTPIYRPLEESGWRRIEIETFANTSAHRAKRSECLWLSPNCQINRPRIPAYRDENKDSLTNRQKSALRIHKYRREQSESAIRDAISSLRRMKKRVTQIEVAHMTGISREHLSRYYRHLF